jgi:replicative DNA helicase
MSAAQHMPGAKQAPPKQPPDARVPPHDLAYERAVLGGVLTDNAALDQVLDVVEAKHFYSRANGVVWDAMLEVHGRGEPIDGVTLRAQLVDRGALQKAGGDEHLLALTEHPPNVKAIETYAKRVRVLAILRELGMLAHRTGARIYGPIDDVDAFFDEVEAEFFAITQQRYSERSSLEHIAETAGAAVEDARHREAGARSTHTTGIPALDHIFDGWDRGDLIVFAGDSGAGKSSTMLATARAQAQSGERVLIVSLEDGRVRWGRRSVHLASGVPIRDLKRGALSTQQWGLVDGGVAKLHREPIWSAFPLGGSITEVLAAIRRARHEHGITVAYVDYLQAVDDDSSNELRHLIRKWLSELRRETVRSEPPLTIVVGSQYRKREDDTKRPKDGDLYEANYIHQKADAIVHVWRDEHGARWWYMSKHKDEDARTGALTRDQTTGMIADGDSEAVHTQAKAASESKPRRETKRERQVEFGDDPASERARRERDAAWKSGAE